MKYISRQRQTLLLVMMKTEMQKVHTHEEACIQSPFIYVLLFLLLFFYNTKYLLCHLDCKVIEFSKGSFQVSWEIM